MVESWKEAVGHLSVSPVQTGGKHELALIGDDWPKYCGCTVPLLCYQKKNAPKMGDAAMLLLLETEKSSTCTTPQPLYMISCFSLIPAKNNDLYRNELRLKTCPKVTGKKINECKVGSASAAENLSICSPHPQRPDQMCNWRPWQLLVFATHSWFSPSPVYSHHPPTLWSNTKPFHSHNNVNCSHSPRSSTWASNRHHGTFC